MSDHHRPGIVAWGTYLPSWRLQRSSIGSLLGGPSGRGTRSVASYDEDTTTMAAEAVRNALRGIDAASVRDLFFSTPDPVYLDKTNAVSVHAAAGLPLTAGAYDLAGSSRSAVAAVRAAQGTAGAGHRTIAVASDLRTGLPGSVDERDGGDGATALVFGTEDPAAEVLATATASTEFLDRWRTPGEHASSQWEERFGQEVYGSLVGPTVADALSEAGLEIDAIDHVIVSGLHARATKDAARTIGADADRFADDLVVTAGNLGAAQPWTMLSDVLDRATPGRHILIVVLADGVDALVLRTTPHVAKAVARRRASGAATVAELVASARDVDYARFLTWRGHLRREPPRRPDPERPGAPATWRSAGWRGGFEASRCLECGFRHLPPTRVCLGCRAVDRMAQERLAEVPGRIVTFTVDRLAYSLSPPVIGVVVDFDGGGRYRCQLTDADPDSLEIGQHVEMAFRRISSAQGVHNYFWKARPVRRRAVTGARP